jgi:hypothetical protein
LSVTSASALHLRLSCRERARRRPQQTARHRQSRPPGALGRPSGATLDGLSVDQGEAPPNAVCRRIGPALRFERPWQEVGCRSVLTTLAGQRQFAFAAERAVFLTVLHRLFVSGSCFGRPRPCSLATRPIYHGSDMAIRGHVFCSILALLLAKELEDRLRRHGVPAEWDDILRDFDRLQEITLEQDKGFLLRTPTAGVAGKLFQAVGVALPPNVQELPLSNPQPTA